MGRIFKHRVYIHPDAPRHFDSERDARGWCTDNGKDPTFIMGFDSTEEWKRWENLREMEKRGEIWDLRRQVEYTLIPKQTHSEVIGEKKVITWMICGIPFKHKTEAVAWCKKAGIEPRNIMRIESIVPRYKEVVDELPVTYRADFVYRVQSGEEVVEDCKSDYTRKEKDYIIKRKLMLHVHRIKIYEFIAKKK